MALGKVPGSEEESEGLFAEINITPLTDIFLVLLVIFMVTSSVIVNRSGGGRAGLKVDLPRGGTADVTAVETDLSVAILADGRLVLSGDVVTQEELQRALEETRQKNPQTLVILQADQGVPHGRVVEVMELAKGAGLAQLAIGVRQQPR